MTINIHIKLKGDAEKLINELINLGLTEQDIIAKAFGLLNLAVRTERLALLNADKSEVEYIFALKMMEKLIDPESRTVEVRASVPVGYTATKTIQVERYAQEELSAEDEE